MEMYEVVSDVSIFNINMVLSQKLKEIMMMEQIRKNTKSEKIIVVLSACMVFAIMQGLHDNYGIMLNGLVEITGLSYASVSFVIGVGAFVYGLAQPVMGMLALKKSNGLVMLLGIILITIGLIATPFCRNFPMLLIFFGLVLPFGTTGLAFAILMGALTPVIGEKRAAFVSGFLQASAGIGDSLMSPALERSIAGFGMAHTLFLLSAPFIIMIPVICWIDKRSRVSELANNIKDETAIYNKSFKSILGNAFKDPDYRRILIGFSTCGFNMSIIESHLFSQYVSYGIPGVTASLTLTVYGIATMLGAVLTGYLGSKLRMKNVLGSVYGIRVIISLGFLLLPKNIPFAFIATALLGLTGDSTVPPTSGIISRKFGSKEMGVLYGFALIGHQAGAFASASLGGYFVKAGMGYTPLWVINLCLAGVAAFVSFRIKGDKQYEQ